MDDLGFLNQVESHTQEVTATTWEGAQNKAVELINERAHGEPCGLCYIEPWHNFKALPLLRCMDYEGDILRVTIETAKHPTDEAPGEYKLHYSRWQIDTARLDAMRAH